MHQKWIFIASGTGIAPFHSYIRSFDELDYTIIHGIRYQEEAYDKENYPSARYISCTSKDTSGTFHGRVTDYLRTRPADLNAVHMLCGNSNMIHEVMDILTEGSAYIVVPEAHVEEGRTRANRIFDPGDPYTRPLLRIFSSESKPQDALVTVQSRGYWFYIDDRDIDSKKAFSFLMILMQLSAAQEESRAPVVTIGTGG